MARITSIRGRFESLEKRLLLAGDFVSAVVAGTNVTITGDGKDDAFLLAGDGTAGDLVITGFNAADGNPTQIKETQNSRIVTGTPDGAITLTGVTGNIAINLGSGDAVVSVANLIVAKNLTIGGAGDDTIDIGTVSPATTPIAPLPADAVTVGGNLTIATGSGDDAISIGERSGSAAPDVTVSGAMFVMFGNGEDDFSELSLAVTRDETIQAGSGDDTITIGGLVGGFWFPIAEGSSAAANLPATSVLAGLSSPGVSVGRSLSISLGNGSDNITEQSLTVAGNESIRLGSGDDNVTLGYDLSTVFRGPVPEVAFMPLFAQGPVSIGGNLDLTMGSGQDTLFAGNLQVAGTLFITGGFGGFIPGANGASSADTVTLQNVTANATEIFMGPRSTDTVDIEESDFADLDVVLGAGDGSLSIGNTTTTGFTTLVGLGSASTYEDLGGNTLAVFRLWGLMPIQAPAPTLPIAVFSAAAL